ncbi:MarR family transcriptional regulator [Bacillus atrophaeus]|uniref:MarR family winged helix-turn-helix transcriptional regulator n=1 Tax=Bacillus atrophaeus TaxID=1452 RepID=UPI0022820069|nr:MarR family transcriptional regulator [Bacillus atrophaeus]MCY9162678.1 MarR family transcriptional regulator [Bacillus atrophaeus]
MEIDQSVNQLNLQWTDIYYSLHYKHEDNISHQAVRLLQYIDKNSESTIGNLADCLSISHNTASEHTKRLIQKGLAAKYRSEHDERKVFVALTEKGRLVLERNTQLDKEKLKSILERISVSERELIEKAFYILSKEAKQWQL